MSLGINSMKSPDGEVEMLMIPAPKHRLARPFALGWGLAALLLFTIFAVLTQLQFNKISDDRLFEAEMQTYNVQKEAYEVAEKANADCLNTIERQEATRVIYTGIADLFQLSADLPVALLPESQTARAYQETLSAGIEEKIHDPVAQGLPVRYPSDCPPVPANKPVRPTK